MLDSSSPGDEKHFEHIAAAPVSDDGALGSVKDSEASDDELLKSIGYKQVLLNHRNINTRKQDLMGSYIGIQERVHKMVNPVICHIYHGSSGLRSGNLLHAVSCGRTRDPHLDLVYGLILLHDHCPLQYVP